MKGEGSKAPKPAADACDDVPRPEETDEPSESSKRKLCSVHCELPFRIMSEKECSD